MKKLLSTLMVMIFSVAVFAQATNYEDYVGTYVFEDAPFDKLIITVEDGDLIAEADMLGVGEITPTDEKDEFGEPNYQALLKFLRNSNGHVTEVEISAQGMILYGAKEGADINLNDYAGVFNFEDAPFDYIEITVDGDDLIAEADMLGAGEIYPTDVADEFSEPNYQALLQFLRADNGEVNSLQVSAEGSIWVGEKEVKFESEYVGEYVFADNDYLSEISVVAASDGGLSIITNIGNSNLEPSNEKDIFELTAVDGKLGFDRDANGKVVGLKIIAMGALFEAQKK